MGKRILILRCWLWFQCVLKLIVYLFDSIQFILCDFTALNLLFKIHEQRHLLGVLIWQLSLPLRWQTSEIRPWSAIRHQTRIRDKNPTNLMLNHCWKHPPQRKVVLQPKKLLPKNHQLGCRKASTGTKEKISRNLGDIRPRTWNAN